MRGSRRGAFGLVVVLALLAGLSACTGGTPTTTPTRPGTVTVRYGPFTVPAATKARMGMLQNRIATNVARPCSNCFITGMQAGLVTADGQPANVDNGLWLHHMVMFDSAKRDLTCPGTGVGLLGQRFFSSGNERTPTKTNGSPYGYRLGTNDSWSLIYDLMNMNGTAKSVYITVTFDFVPGNTPGYKDITPVWLDINQCLTSERAAKTGAYSYTYQVTSTVNGKLLGIGGHLHDGGTHLTIDLNGRQICDSVATYGGNPAYIESPESLHMPGMGHISEMSRCQGTPDDPVAAIKSGDQIKLTAYYDSNAHMQMGTDPIMGIAIGYLALD